MLRYAIPCWRGKSGRREGVKQLCLLLSLLILLLLPNFHSFPAVLFHCALNLSIYSSIPAPDMLVCHSLVRTDQCPRPPAIGAQSWPQGQPSDSQATDAIAITSTVVTGDCAPSYKYPARIPANHLKPPGVYCPLQSRRAQQYL